MSNTEIPKAARAEAERWMAESPETVASAVAWMIEHITYLSMKAEWEMEDNLLVTESLSLLFPVLDLADEEVVEAASYFGLDSDHLDDLWGEAYDRAMERTEED